MTQKIQQRSRWQKIRKLCNDIHLYLGLASGLVVLLVCFSGTIYVYNTELVEAAAPHLYKVKTTPGTLRQPVDSLASQVERLTGGTIASITVPASATRSFQFSVKQKGESRNITYMVNPYTGELLGSSKEKNGTREWMSTFFSMHRWLLLDKIEKPIFGKLPNRKLGSIITGWATILFTLGCLTGLIIWFPQKVRNWKQGLKIKIKANWKRVNHDLHNTLAFYALVFLLLMGLTGPFFSFDWYRAGLQKTLGTYKPKTATPEKAPESILPADTNTVHLPASALLNIASSELSYKGDCIISMPASKKGTIGISKYRTGFFAPAAGDRLTLDQYTGTVLKKDIFRDRPFNQRVAGSIKSLHLGNVYGGFTKLIYFLACLIATSLPITGTLIWINKMKKKPRPLPAS